MAAINLLLFMFLIQIKIQIEFNWSNEVRYANDSSVCGNFRNSFSGDLLQFLCGWNTHRHTQTKSCAIRLHKQKLTFHLLSGPAEYFNRCVVLILWEHYWFRIHRRVRWEFRVNCGPQKYFVHKSRAEEYS